MENVHPPIVYTCIHVCTIYYRFYDSEFHSINSFRAIVNSLTVIAGLRERDFAFLRLTCSERMRMTAIIYGRRNRLNLNNREPSMFSSSSVPCTTSYIYYMTYIYILISLTSQLHIHLYVHRYDQKYMVTWFL